MKLGDNCCQHGQLARSCNICDLESEVARLSNLNKEMLEALKHANLGEKQVNKQDLRGRAIQGYMFSYMTSMGKERLVASTFGTSVQKAKQHLQHVISGNIARGKHMFAHKLYSVQINVIEERSCSKTRPANE